MRRMVLVLVTAALIAATVALSIPATAVAQDEQDEMVAEQVEVYGAGLERPQCGWYESSNDEEEWWEYWCYYRGSGWEFIFWTW